MKKKFLCIALIMVLLLFSGCSANKEIDKISLVQAVIVTKGSSDFTYSFFVINKKEKIDINAKNFTEAYKLAKEKYIPNISLGKMEMILINEKIYEKMIKNDIYYMAKLPQISPLSYVCSISDNGCKYIMKNYDGNSEYESHIEQLNNYKSNIKSNLLSVFNSIFNDNCNNFYVVNVDYKNGIRADLLKIVKNNEKNTINFEK